MLVNQVGVQQMENNPMGGLWSENMKIEHINYLELFAVKLAVGYKELWQGCKHLRIRCDNTTAIAYINNMGD